LLSRRTRRVGYAGSHRVERSSRKTAQALTSPLHALGMTAHGQRGMIRLQRSGSGRVHVNILLPSVRSRAPQCLPGTRSRGRDTLSLVPDGLSRRSTRSLRSTVPRTAPNVDLRERQSLHGSAVRSAHALAYPCAHNGTFPIQSPGPRATARR